MLIPDLFLVENKAREFELTKDIISRFASSKFIFVDSIEEFLHNNSKEQHQIPKDVVALSIKKGDVVKKIDYYNIQQRKAEFFILHSINCPYNCHYCFLQHYFPHPIPVIYVNIDEILKSIDDFLVKIAKKYKVGDNVYFHSGELCDGLALDDLTNFAEKLIDIFRKYNQLTLEIRTKSTSIANILKTTPAENIIISWTMSPKEVVDLYEEGTPSVEERILSAVQCQKHGFKVGIRFDPVIIFNGWKESYLELFNKTFTQIDTGNIDPCVVGVIRCHPLLWNIVKEKYPNSKLLSGEFVLAKDKKYKYARPYRQHIYNFFKDTLSKIDDRIQLLICMDCFS